MARLSIAHHSFSMQEVLDHLYALSQLCSSRRRHRKDSTARLARLKVVECGNTVRTSRLAFFVTCHVSLSLVTCNKDMAPTLLSHAIWRN